VVASSGCLFGFYFYSWVQKKRKGTNGNFPASNSKAIKVAEREREGSKALFEFSFTSKKGVFVSGITRVP